MGNKLIVLIFGYIFLSACGLRKTNIEKDKNVVETKTEINLKKNIDSTGFKKEENLKTETTDVALDKEKLTTEIKTKETFNSDGTLKTRTTSTKTSAKRDKSKTQKAQSEITTKVDLSAFEDHSELTYIRESDSTKVTKSKQIDANNTIVKNVGGSGVVITCFIVVVIAIFGYTYFKRNRLKK